jgi:hypothetical protein
VYFQGTSSIHQSLLTSRCSTVFAGFNGTSWDKFPVGAEQYFCRAAGT